jgi:hypothetical protein
MTGAHAPVLKAPKFNCVKYTQRTKSKGQGAKNKEQGQRRKYSKRKEEENLERTKI